MNCKTLIQEFCSRLERDLKWADKSSTVEFYSDTRPSLFRDEWVCCNW